MEVKYIFSVRAKLTIWLKILGETNLTLRLKAKAEFVLRDSNEVQEMPARVLNFEEKAGVSRDSVCIKITPGKKVATYGVGIKLLEMRFPEKARNLVDLN